jgi:hypothetical protein
MRPDSWFCVAGPSNDEENRSGADGVVAVQLFAKMAFAREPLHMITVFRLIPLAAVALAFSVAGASAQNNNPGNSAGSNGSLVATPTYPAGEAPDPALSPGRLPKTVTNVPADENPNVPGATGETIVHGDRSTIGGDRRATIEQKSGDVGSDGSN